MDGRRRELERREDTRARVDRDGIEWEKWLERKKWKERNRGENDGQRRMNKNGGGRGGGDSWSKVIEERKYRWIEGRRREREMVR